MDFTVCVKFLCGYAIVMITRSLKQFSQLYYHRLVYFGDLNFTLSRPGLFSAKYKSLRKFIASWVFMLERYIRTFFFLLFLEKGLNFLIKSSKSTTDCNHPSLNYLPVPF